MNPASAALAGAYVAGALGLLPVPGAPEAVVTHDASVCGHESAVFTGAGDHQTENFGGAVICVPGKWSFLAPTGAGASIKHVVLTPISSNTTFYRSNWGPGTEEFDTSFTVDGRTKTLTGSPLGSPNARAATDPAVQDVDWETGNWVPKICTVVSGTVMDCQ